MEPKPVGTPAATPAAKKANAAGSLAIPQQIDPKVKKLHELLVSKGINGIDLTSLQDWYTKAAPGGITMGELQGLLGGKIGWFDKFVDPIRATYVINLSEESWGAFLADEKTGVVSDIDILTAKLDEMFSLGEVQGKSPKQMMEANRINWVNIPEVSQQTQEYILDFVTKRINGDSTLTPGQRTTLIANASKYIKTGQIKMLKGLNFDLGPQKPYNYLEGMDEALATYLSKMEESTMGIKDPVKRVNMLYTKASLTCTYNDYYSLKTVYTQERNILEAGAFDTFGKVFDNIGKTKTRIGELDKKIAAEEAKPVRDEAALTALRDEKKEAEVELKLLSRFYQFSLMFTQTGGKNYERILGNDLEFKPGVTEQAKPQTLTGWIHLFVNPDQIKGQIQAKAPGSAPQPQPQGGTAVPKKPT